MRNLTLLIFSLVLIFNPLFAQPNISVVATDLRHPVGIETDANGNLWVAETGTGQHDGAVTVIWEDGTVERVIDNLPSVILEGSGETSGPMRVQMLSEDLIAVFSGELPDSLGNSAILIYNIDSILSAPAPLGREDIVHEIQVGETVLGWGFENSNPFSLVHDGCDLYFVDAGANSIIRRDGLSGVLEVFATFSDIPNPTSVGPPMIDPVPTRILAKEGGGFVVSQLTGFPFVDNLSNVFDVTADGEISVLDSNLTLVTDLRFHPSGEGLLALQFANFNLANVPPFLIGSSMITYLHESGSRDTVAMGFGPSPGMVVTNDSTFFLTQIFTGEVIQITASTTDVENPGIKTDHQLHIFPNPGKDEVTVAFPLDRASNIRMKVYEASGRLVQDLDLGRLPAGEQQVPLNGSRFHQGGTQYYFIRLDGEGIHKWGTLLLGQ